MSCRTLSALALAPFIALLTVSHAFAHCFVGARFLPATLAIDDPCVADEISFPTVAWFKTADINRLVIAKTSAHCRHPQQYSGRTSCRLL